jgi:hypothetical protein
MRHGLPLPMSLFCWLLLGPGLTLSEQTGALRGRPPSAPPSRVAASVRTVENAGLLFTDNPAGVSGTDAGYSLPMGGQTLWLFGDVFLLDRATPARTYVGAISNCALLVPAGKGSAPLRRYTFLTDPATGLARPVLSSTDEEKQGLRFWPLGGWYNPTERRACLYYARVRVTGEGPFGFRIEGSGLAEADTRVPGEMRFRRLPAQPDQALWWTPDNGRPLFGSAVITAPSGDYLYIVGWQERDGRKWGKLARVPKARIKDRDAYEYFAGGEPSPRWSRAIQEAADVEGLSDFPVELSVAYNAYLGGYLAVHSVGISERLRLSLAPAPWGPYRPVAEIGAPHRALERAFCYAGKEHPELAQERGRILYITYVDSERYWLQLLKVTLQRGGE